MTDKENQLNLLAVPSDELTTGGIIGVAQVIFTFYSNHLDSYFVR